jgi:isopenicillin N synthase-like dioxygenase
MTLDQSASVPTVPLLDLALILDTSNRGSEREEALHTLARACRESGAFSVTNHGLDMQVIGGLLALAAEFFALPAAEKAKIRGGDGPGDRGYRETPMGNGRSHDTFFWIDNLELVHGSLDLNPGTNRWPENPPRFRALVQASGNPLAQLSARVFRAIALGAGLPENALDFMNEVRTMQIHRYDPEVELAQHTDMAPLTIIFADEEGLEAQLADGRWAPVPATRGSLSCMLGDVAMHVTNDRYRTAVHRVVRSPHQRHSIVWEPGCHPGAMIGPFAEFCSTSEPARYERRTFIDIARDWIEAKERAPSPH